MLPLIIAIANARTPVTAHSVDFVDEDDAGGGLLRLFKHVTNAACAYADKHFNKVRAGNGEERHIGLSRNRTSKQSLAGAGCADQQRTLGDFATKLGEFGRIFQEIDNLLKLLTRFVNPSHIGKGYLAILFREHLRAAFAKAHRAGTGTLLHLAHDEKANAEDQQEGQGVNQHHLPDAGAFLRLATKLHTRPRKPLCELRIRNGIDIEHIAIGHFAHDKVAGKHHFLDRAFIHLCDEIGIGDAIRLG